MAVETKSGGDSVVGGMCESNRARVTSSEVGSTVKPSLALPLIEIEGHTHNWMS